MRCGVNLAYAVKDINRVVLTGEVVADAALAYTPRGTGVVTFTLAFSIDLHDGGQQKGTIDIVCLGEVAKRCKGMVKRSAKVKVEGRLQQRSWKTPEGFYKSKTEIVADTVDTFNAGTTPEAG